LFQVSPFDHTVVSPLNHLSNAQTFTHGFGLLSKVNSSVFVFEKITVSLHLPW
jgi:hypothetical protein